MTDVDRRPLLGVTELAERLGLGHRSARRLIDRKQIPSFKVGGLVKVEQADVDRYIERCKADGDG